MNSKEFIYVGNLPKNAREENIRDFFMPSGNALRIYFMRQSSPTKIAFLQFEDEDQAKDACVLDQTTFDNHRLTIMAADEEKFFYAKKTIIVRNILQDTTEEIIYDLFKSYGTIEYVQIPTAYYAYVGFKEESVAISAAADPNLSIRNNKLTLQILRRNIPIKLESLDSLRKDPNYTKDPPIRGQAQNQQRSWNEGQRRNENQQAESTKQDTRKPDRNENQFRNGNENQFDQKARVEESYQKRKPSSYEEKHSVVEKVAPRPPTITESITVEKTLTLIKPQAPHTSYDIEEKTKLLYSELNKLEAQKAKLQALLEKQSNVIETEKTEKQKQVFSEDVVMKDMETIVDLTVEHYTGDEVLSSEMTFTLPTDDDTGYKNCMAQRLANTQTQGQGTTSPKLPAPGLVQLARSQACPEATSTPLSVQEYRPKTRGGRLVRLALQIKEMHAALDLATGEEKRQLAQQIAQLKKAKRRNREQGWRSRHNF